MTKKEHKKVGNLLKGVMKNLITLDMNHPTKKEMDKVIGSALKVQSISNLLEDAMCRDYPEEKENALSFYRVSLQQPKNE